jgi:hypothetical protein
MPKPKVKAEDVLPWCAVCDKRVDSIEEIRQPHVRKTLYIVRCHGQEERTVLGDEVILDSYSIEVGTAFATRRLGAHDVDTKGRTRDRRRDPV